MDLVFVGPTTMYVCSIHVVCSAFFPPPSNFRVMLQLSVVPGHATPRAHRSGWIGPQSHLALVAKCLVLDVILTSFVYRATMRER